jgi:hypothetical protein
MWSEEWMKPEFNQARAEAILLATLVAKSIFVFFNHDPSANNNENALY